MRDVSNKTIVGLLFIALVVTIVGTFISISNLTKMPVYGTLTAAATSTATGQANITIQASTSITNRVQNIDFGSGFADGGTCVMDSNGQHNQTGAFCQFWILS
ncbi:hypothetical protein J4228_04465 [Candidatus Woesearchaeota archaeon]|nr:hypothetical protein [Candidatus Woesearchaeota archaeon]